MKKRSKRYLELSKRIDKSKSYKIIEAINLLQDSQKQKLRFIESVEAHVNLNIDPKKADQQLRTTLNLPEGIGKSKRIAALVEMEQFDIANKAGADLVGEEELIEKIQKNLLDFDILITTANLMPKLAKLGRILGPKGLMPSPKTGTITSDLESTIKDFKKGKIEYRNDKEGNIHLAFGLANFTSQQLVNNLKAVFNSIEKNKPNSIKGKYFKNFTVSTTMGPSIRLDLDDFKNSLDLEA